MNYTQEQLAALSDIELSLIIARDVAGLNAVIVTRNFPAIEKSIQTVEYYIYGDGNTDYMKEAPDYLDDLNAIDDLCKEKGFGSIRNTINSSKTVTWRIRPPGFGRVFTVIQDRDKPKCWGGCIALVLAHQESKK